MKTPGSRLQTSGPKPDQNRRNEKTSGKEAPDHHRDLSFAAWADRLRRGNAKY